MILDQNTTTANNLKLDTFDMVLFGATGDLDKRKLVRALFRPLPLRGRFRPARRIIGVRALYDLSNEQYFGEVRESLEKTLNHGELTPEKCGCLRQAWGVVRVMSMPRSNRLSDA